MAGSWELLRLRNEIGVELRVGRRLLGVRPYGILCKAEAYCMKLYQQSNGFLRLAEVHGNLLENIALSSNQTKNKMSDLFYL